MTYVYEPLAVISTPHELAYWMGQGIRCFAHFDQTGCTFKTSPAAVVAINGDRIKISHWSDYWIPFHFPRLTVRLGFKPPTVCDQCRGTGWVRPKLGVNCAAGSAVGIGTARSLGYDNRFPCEKCNLPTDFDRH